MRNTMRYRRKKLKLRDRKRLAISLSIIVAIILLSAQLVSTLTSTDLNPAGAGSDPYLIVNGAPAPAYPIPIEHGIQSGVDNTGWTAVPLSYSYTSPVVIATPSYSSSEPPLVTRIQNATGTSFDVRVQRADGSTTAISGVDVHWIVIEAGTYDIATYGLKFEAGTKLSTITDDDGSWVAQSHTYANTYTSPVVIGQVMTYADTDWSVFWARGSSRANPPDASNLWLGKHVGEHADNVRNDETLGYIVFESGSGSIGSVNYEAGVGADTVKGWGDNPPYIYTHSVSAATTVILSSAAMDVTDGAWPVLHEPSPVSSTDFDLVAQEDQEANAELKHKDEQVAYIVLD